VAAIKYRRTEWLGHVMRMESSRVPQKILDGKHEEKRCIGRPRLRWLDDDVNDLRNMGVRQWRKKAKDRLRMGRNGEGSNG
jgi:hypothetical protein